MVFFVCEVCSESVKKNKVEKHLFKCHNAFYFSCVDCSITFDSKSFKNHTSCISEEKKTHGKLYKHVEKKQTLQDRWFNFVSGDVSGLDSEESTLLSKIVEFDNVPRKEKKFKNFVRNSVRSGGRNQDMIVDRLWKKLKEQFTLVEKKRIVEDEMKKNERQTIGEDSAESPKQVKRKRSISDNEDIEKKTKKHKKKKKRSKSKEKKKKSKKSKKSKSA